MSSPVTADYLVNDASGALKDNRQGRASVDGWSINLATEASAINAIVGAAKAAQGFVCFTLNLDHLVWLRRSEAFRQAYSRARFVTADGAPVAFMARRQWPEVKRTTGADLLVPLCQAAANADLPIYLFGTCDAALKAASDSLVVNTGGRLRIAGMEAPPQGFDVDSAAADAAMARIAQSGARLCFVMLGAPKQELFATRAVDLKAACGFICVGAAADFIVGQQVRAPRLMQRIGLEWAWRLASDPRRLGRRYLRCAVLFARLDLGYRLRALIPGAR